MTQGTNAYPVISFFIDSKYFYLGSIFDRVRSIQPPNFKGGVAGRSVLSLERAQNRDLHVDFFKEKIPTKKSHRSL